VFATHQTRYAFLAGPATAIGAGVSMAFSEGLSDTGDLTGRGRPYLRGAITGAGTFLGGVLHTLPFLIPQYRLAVLLALTVIAAELLALAWIRRAVLRRRLPQLAHLGHARRCGHRHDQRRAWRGQMTAGDASARTPRSAPLVFMLAPVLASSGDSRGGFARLRGPLVAEPVHESLATGADAVGRVQGPAVTP